MLSNLHTMKCIHNKKFCVIQSYIKNFHFKQFSNYVYFIRYVDYFLLGFISSKNFCFYFNKLVSSYIKSCLHFDIKYSTIFDKFEKNIIFAGFNIKLFKTSELNYLFLSKSRSYKKYFFRILNKIELNFRH